jgi:hypothetical protein
MPKISPLKIASLVIGAVGFFVAAELQKRETREMVEEVIAEREAKAATEQQ